MSVIRNFLSADHRKCDESLATIESAVSQKKWDDVKSNLEKFIVEMNRHLSFEENVLFPSLEEATGMMQMPTLVMRAEHAHMREFFEEMKLSVIEKNEDRLLGLSETLMMLIQQHNNKEEQMLYVMCDMQMPHLAQDLLLKFDHHNE